MDFFRFLRDDEVAYVHEASLEILEEVGLLVRNRKARARFAAHGARVDEESEIVRLPAAVVERYRALVPPTLTLRGRDPALDVTFPRKLPVIATASSAPDLVDPVTGETRRARSDDIARIAHLVNELDGFDLFSISTLADDAPKDQFSLSRFYPALKNCTKPCRTSVIDVREAEQVLELGTLIAGSEEAYWERPFINFGYCAIVSPLTMDYDSTEMLMFYAEKGITAYGTIAPMGGLSTPLSLPGMLTLMNAEWLAAATLAQMSKPGTAQIYNFLPVFADMRDGAYAPGAIEIGMMNAAVCQMARFYNVPAGGYLGLTNAKVADAQAGFEKGMSPLLGALAGVDFIVMGAPAGRPHVLRLRPGADRQRDRADDQAGARGLRLLAGERRPGGDQAGRAGRPLCRPPRDPGAHARRHLHAGAGRPQAARAVAAGGRLDDPPARPEQGPRHPLPAQQPRPRPRHRRPHPRPLRRLGRRRVDPARGLAALRDRRRRGAPRTPR